MSLSNLSACESTRMARDHQPARLCVPCSTLDIERLLLGQEVNHHKSYSSLLEAAHNGCELCELVRKSTVLGDAHVPTKARFIVRNVLKLDYAPERITPQTPIMALGFYRAHKKRISVLGHAEIDVCTTWDDPLCDIVERRLIQPDCGSQNGLQVAISWLQKCLTSHHELCKNVESPLPKRVIYIGRTDTTSDPYLLETDNKNGAWVALSHCWGQGTSFTTTTTNILDRKKGIPFADFPATFRDAITISRKLGIEHLWIDSLCIIQDSASDWLEESRQMKQVYSNATVTLAAEASEDSHSGIFTSANAGRAKPVHIPFHDGRGGYSGSLYSQALLGPVPCVGTASYYAPGPLSYRAWGLQEDVLSQRVLRYASDQLFWSCRTSFHPESKPSGFGANQFIYDLRNFRRQTQSSNTEIQKRVLLLFWYTIIGHYRNRRLTFEKDKFPALSGIAMEMAERLKYTYAAGLWMEDIHAGLLWLAIGTYCRSKEYVAPSWSWACLTQLRASSIYGFPTSRDEDFTSVTIAEILRVDVSTVGGDPYGQVTAGSLRVRGPSKNITYCAKSFNSAAMELHFDVGKEELDSDILCMQILKGRPSDGTVGPYKLSSTSCILLKPTGEVDWYQRIGVAFTRPGSMELEDGWEVREVTVV